MAKPYFPTWEDMREARICLLEITYIADRAVSTDKDREHLKLWGAVVGRMLRDGNDEEQRTPVCDLLEEVAAEWGVSFSTLYRKWERMLAWIRHVVSEYHKR